MTTVAHGPDRTPHARRADRYSWQRLILTLDLPEEIKGFALVLATYANADGSGAHPGNSRLAFDTGRDKRTVIRRLAVLRDELGLITRTYRARKGRPKPGDTPLSDAYQLTVPADLEARIKVRVYRPLSGDTTMSPLNQEVVTPGPEVVTSTPGSGDTQMSPHRPSTQTCKEHSSESRTRQHTRSASAPRHEDSQSQYQDQNQDRDDDGGWLDAHLKMAYSDYDADEFCRLLGVFDSGEDHLIVEAAGAMIEREYPRQAVANYVRSRLRP